MTTITIRGPNENMTKREAMRATDFFAKQLLGRIYKHVDIEVEFVRLRGMWGSCGVTTVHNGKFRDFGIYVNSNLCKRNQIITIAHEMVHLKQFARGEFSCLGPNKYIWKNRVLRLSDEKYLSFPWEKEAYAKEKMLYELYKESH